MSAFDQDFVKSKPASFFLVDRVIYVGRVCIAFVSNGEVRIDFVGVEAANDIGKSGISGYEIFRRVVISWIHLEQVLFMMEQSVTRLPPYKKLSGDMVYLHLLDGDRRCDNDEYFGGVFLSVKKCLTIVETAREMLGLMYGRDGHDGETESMSTFI